MTTRKTIDGQHRSRDPHADWCRNLFASLNDGGVWGVPRSGLTFKRRGDRLVLVDRAMGFDSRDQQADYLTIRQRFGAANIAITDETT
jgi:hypothetical protein